MREIYVGNLPFDATEQDVRDAFEHYGDVTSVKIIKDRETGRSRGVAFVTMSDSAEAAEAVRELNQTHIAGRRVTVQASKGHVARTREADFGHRRRVG